jgi:hypothetical protein
MVQWHQQHANNGIIAKYKTREETAQDDAALS